MLQSFSITNYKSIVDLSLELGRFNVFIGENGCGKSNVLEAFGMAAAGATNRLSNEDLYNRGIRLARPSLIRNSFSSENISKRIEVQWKLSSADDIISLTFDTSKEYFSRYAVFQHAEETADALANIAVKHIEGSRMDQEVRRLIQEILKRNEGLLEANLQKEAISHFGIYNANTLALRGLQVESRREPLGLHGEGLDVAIARLSPLLREQLSEHARLVSWVDDIEIDEQGARKQQGSKPGRSMSELYFRDRFMAEDNCVFSAENANEGVLHVLFYLALFMSEETPKFFAIDNIETSLNPRLLRHMIKLLAQLSKEHDKQALITTHNPAALDGLNLNDDEQRLFEVYRSDEGHTRVRRIKTKPEQPGGEKLKLSEMWMRGLLGAIPQHF
jgi:predicted ATPase